MVLEVFLLQVLSLDLDELLFHIISDEASHILRIGHPLILILDLLREVIGQALNVLLGDSADDPQFAISVKLWRLLIILLRLEPVLKEGDVELWRLKSARVQRSMVQILHLPQESIPELAKAFLLL